MISKDDIRWKQRFENLKLAYKHLKNAVDDNLKMPNNDTMRMGLIQAFHIAFELCWKTMKDYLESNAIDVQLSRDAIKHAFKHGIIADGAIWIQMLNDRNILAHTYDLEKTTETIKYIADTYILHIHELCEFFEKKM